MGGAESQGSPGQNNVSQVDEVSDMATTCWLCGCLGGGFRKGAWLLPAFLSERKLSPSSCLDAKHFSSFLYATGAFQAAILVLELRRVSLSKCICGFFNGNCLGLQKFLSLTQSLLGFAAISYGDSSSWHWSPEQGLLVWGWDSSLSRYLFQICIHHTWMWDQSIPHVCLS